MGRSVPRSARLRHRWRAGRRLDGNGQEQALERGLADEPCSRIGVATDDGRLVIRYRGQIVVDEEVFSLKEAWKAPMREL